MAPPAWAGLAVAFGGSGGGAARRVRRSEAIAALEEESAAVCRAPAHDHRAMPLFISDDASYITGQILGVNGGRNT